MRMLPSRYIGKAQPIRVKKKIAEIEHFSAPLKGLDLTTQLSGDTQGVDRLTAPILKNFNIYEDRIQTRSGTRIVSHHTAGKPIESLIPYYGAPQALAAATNGEICRASDMGLIRAGFTGNDWSWTSFSNQGQQDYTLMANGKDGVWSWTGGMTPAGTPVAATNLSKTNPAVITVAAASIGQFTNGMLVFVAGAVGTGLVNANGYHTIGSVNSPVNTFTLVGVDTSSAAAAQTSGVTVATAGSIIKETITAPPSEPWFIANDINIVLSHMNRVWMADTNNLVVAYLPLQQKSGEVKFLPLNAIFKRGGSIRALATWSIDGGSGLDDKLVIFTSNGEAAIYTGIDPDSDFDLVGIFRFDAPMSKHCVINFGGDLYVLTSTGLLPMSTVIRAEMEQLGQYDKNVVSAFRSIAMPQRNISGWCVVLDHGNGRVVCNLPKGYINNYTQMVRTMADPTWVEWADVKSRCWNWFDNKLWFGDDSGNFWAMDRTLLNDNGFPIKVDVQWAWSDFGTPAGKQFKLVRPYIVTDGIPAPFVDIRVDYDLTPPQNQPDATFATVGTEWELGEWDVSDWSSGTITYASWNGVAGYGRVAAPRIAASISNCIFAISGVDVIYEQGSIF